jgi:hypothetical protein
MLISHIRYVISQHGYNDKISSKVSKIRLDLNLFQNLDTRREAPTMGKQLGNFITCGCESSGPFFIIYKAAREPTPYW